MSGSLQVSVRQRPGCRSRERGAVAVEFALVLPLVVMLLMGSVTAGVAYSRAVGLTNAVREGARFGATTLNGGGWAAAVIERTRQTQFDDPGVETTICAELRKNDTALPAQPATTLQSTPGGCPAVAGPPPTLPTVDKGKCVALVWAVRHYRIDLGVFPTLEGDTKRQAVARYERTC